MAACGHEGEDALLYQAVRAVGMELCPELDIASQGDSVSEARENLREALELFLETASSSEIQERLHDEIYVTQLEVAVA
jgi:predicted RNase H-like HicB family nuclease